MNFLLISETILLIFGVTNIFRLNAKWVNHEKCGLKPAENFIVGGSDAEEHEFPFMIGLWANNSIPFCGGTLISEKWVLTAAHCVPTGKQHNISALIGHNDKKKRPTNEFDLRVVHECYDKREPNSDDIGLLRFKNPVKIDWKTIGTICLPPSGKEPISYDMTIIGWGVWTETYKLQEEGFPNILQKTQTKTVSEEFCEYYFYYKNIGIYGGFPIKGNKLCFRGSATACRGDSGGPAFQEVNGRRYQMGVTSHGAGTLPIWNTCYKTSVNFYTKVSAYVDWIAEKVEKYGNISAKDYDLISKPECN